MEKDCFTVSMEKNPIISVKVYPGHFTTSNKHSNYFLDVSSLKFNTHIARDAAQELARPYLTNKIVNTIVCMEATEVIGAYLAQELSQYGTAVINEGGDINIVTPARDYNGNFIFQDNMKEWIMNKGIILLVTSISSGSTVKRAIECIDYYGGKLEGISALFMTSPDLLKYEVNTLFTSADIPGYKLFTPGDCEMCKAGQKLDAIINSEGYTIIN
jgi:orotate phosphoribosyltransferase